VRAIDLIAAGGIVLRPPCGTFEQAIGALVDALVTNGCLAPDLRDSAVQAIIEREAQSSTAMVEIGVAVPHARVPGVDGVIAALAASPTAVYYAMTGVPISIMVIVLSAPELVGEHLNTLAGISMLLQSDTTRRHLEQAADAATALRALRGA
jgi:PTS system nitrogen regulatory IIA component